MDAIKAIFAAIAAVFGLARDRSALRNSPAMQASAAAKTDAAVHAESTAAVSAATTGDADALDKLRKIAAE